MTDTHLTQPRRSWPRHAFIGAEGLRVGWSILLFLLFAVLLAIVAGLAARLAWHGPPP